MSAPTPDHIITANDLLTGNVVYFTTGDRWSASLEAAEVLSDEAHAQLRPLDAERQHDQIIGAYLALVSQTADGLAPAHFRERTRALGPSNYSHGKQEVPHV